MATFNVQGSVISRATRLGIALAKVKVHQQGQSDPVAEVLTDLTGHFSVNFPWPLDISIPGNRPDIHFKVTQRIDGAERVILNENPATQTRRNIADVLSATLMADEGLSVVPTPSGRPYDTLFVFTRVGVIGVNRIDTVGASASGYADPDISPAAPNSSDANSPFGSTLDIAGWFGAFSDAYRYKIQYSGDAGLTWHDISDPLYNSYFEFAIGGGNWVTQAMGPFTEGGQTNVYKMPYVERPGQPWIFPDLIAKWDTTKVANGLYTLRIQGFKPDATGTTLIPSAAMIIDANYGQLKLRTDNSPPVCRINPTISVASTAGGPFVEKNVCDIVGLTTGTLRLRFEASDAQGHLQSYTLNAMFGHNQVVVPFPVVPNKASDNYSTHVDATRHWNGGAFSIEYDGGPVSPPRTRYTSELMPTCAYQFRLNVVKRTTNGYVKLYSGEDTVHFTINRTP